MCSKTDESREKNNLIHGQYVMHRTIRPKRKEKRKEND